MTDIKLSDDLANNRDASDQERRFCRSLQETLAWLSSKMITNWKSSAYRSTEMQPAKHGGFLDTEAFEPVFARRTLVVRSNDFSAAPIHSDELYSGRLLICDHRASDASGTSKHFTQGYFDDHDLPPWDTWVDVINSASNPKEPRFLVCFVNASLVDLVQCGIGNNPCDVLFWANPFFALSRKDAARLPYHELPSWLLEAAERIKEKLKTKKGGAAQ